MRLGYTGPRPLPLVILSLAAGRASIRAQWARTRLSLPPSPQGPYQVLAPCWVPLPMDLPRSSGCGMNAPPSLPTPGLTTYSRPRHSPPRCSRPPRSRAALPLPRISSCPQGPLPNKDSVFGVKIGTVKDSALVRWAFTVFSNLGRKEVKSKSGLPRRASRSVQPGKSLLISQRGT
jgi:hypothetical protein